MRDDLQLSARAVAGLLARIYGPAIYDLPRYGEGKQGGLDPIGIFAGPRPHPWLEVMLNPQPLPPRESYAVALADSHIQELLTLDRAGALLGGEITERALERAQRVVAEIGDICPDWPWWPKGWPAPPPPPWGLEQMADTQLFLFGSRFLAASDLLELGPLQEATAGLGARVLEMSMRG